MIQDQEIPETPGSSPLSGAGPAKAASGPVQLVEFLLGREYFAIDLFDVREVVEYTHITHLPSAPGHIRGIIDLRGEITTIIDLRTMLSIEDTGERDEKEKRIIVLDPRMTGRKIGIIVDDVRSVSTFDRDQVDNEASFDGGNSQILGIIRKRHVVKGREETELIIWIDIRKILHEMQIGA